MKILLINSVCGRGSTGHIVTDLYARLKNKKHTVKVVFGVGIAANINQCDVIKINSRLGYIIDNILSKLTDKTGFFSYFQTKKLLKFIDNFNPDIIHIHNIHGYYINIKLLFNYIATKNIKIVWTLHDCWAITGHCTHFSFINCNKWKKECYACPQQYRYPRSWFFDNSRNNFIKKKELFTSVKQMSIVTPSKWLAQVVSESFLNKYPITSIPNGIDTSLFKYSQSDFRENIGAENKIILLSVANIWYESKGIYDIYKIAEQLNDKYAYVVVGMNSTQKKLAPKNIIAIDKTNSIKELVDIYSSADVFINTSYEETMGMVTLEAISCGTPAIVYDKTAVPEIIDKSCGIVVQAGNIQEVISNINNAIQLGRNIVPNKALEYSKESQYDKYIRLYEFNSDK